MPGPTNPANVRGLFMGSGGGLADPGMAERVVDLSGRDAADLELLYLGTATYDRDEPRARQTGRFVELGCRVRSLDMATRDPSVDESEAAVARADVVLASGGNTLYAVDRWVAMGIDEQLRAAIARGLVPCGGSAGAICWFDGGHSDSMDPTSYLRPRAADDRAAREWPYIRVAGLGLLPGLICPHFDATQSNGILRATDFGAMMLRHGGERGLGLDDRAGLLVDGGAYRVVRPEGAVGSVRDGRFVDDRSGLPGLWLHDVVNGEVVRSVAPDEGRLDDIVRAATRISEDPLVDDGRSQNPSRLR